MMKLRRGWRAPLLMREATAWASLSCGLLLSLASVAGTLVVSLTEPSAALVPGAVVTVTALDTPLPAPVPVSAAMDQIDLEFRPGVLLIPVGSQVSFPNSDSVSHQVYSFSQAKKFQLPLYRGKPYEPIEFDKPGLVIVGCNIHDSMVGHVYVTDAPVFGITGADGTWTASDLPPGRYEVAVWHARLRDIVKPLKQTVTIAKADQRIETIVRSDSALRPARSSGKPGWDSY